MSGQDRTAASFRGNEPDVLLKCSICDSQFPTPEERDVHYERCLVSAEADERLREQVNRDRSYRERVEGLPEGTLPRV